MLLSLLVSLTGASALSEESLKKMDLSALQRQYMEYAPHTSELVLSDLTRDQMIKNIMIELGKRRSNEEAGENRAYSSSTISLQQPGSNQNTATANREQSNVSKGAVMTAQSLVESPSAMLPVVLGQPGSFTAAQSNAVGSLVDQFSALAPNAKEAFMEALMATSSFKKFKKNALLDLTEELPNYKDEMFDALQDRFATKVELQTRLKTASGPKTKALKSAQQKQIDLYRELLSKKTPDTDPSFMSVRKNLNKFAAGRELLKAEAYDTHMRIDEKKLELDAAKLALTTAEAAVPVAIDPAVIAYNKSKEEALEIAKKTWEQAGEEYRKLKEVEEEANQYGLLERTKEACNRIITAKKNAKITDADIKLLGLELGAQADTDTKDNMKGKLKAVEEILSQMGVKAPFDESRLRPFEESNGAKNLADLKKAVNDAQAAFDDADKQLKDAVRKSKKDASAEKAQVDKLEKELKSLDDQYQKDLQDSDDESLPSTGVIASNP